MGSFAMIRNDFIQETCIADFNQACDTIHCNNGNDKLQACLLSDCHSSDVPEGNLILILKTNVNTATDLVGNKG